MIFKVVHWRFLQVKSFPATCCVKARMRRVISSFVWSGSCRYSCISSTNISPDAQRMYYPLNSRLLTCLHCHGPVCQTTDMCSVTRMVAPPSLAFDLPLHWGLISKQTESEGMCHVLMSAAVKILHLILTKLEKTENKELVWTDVGDEFRSRGHPHFDFE